VFSYGRGVSFRFSRGVEEWQANYKQTSLFVCQVCRTFVLSALVIGISSFILHDQGWFSSRFANTLLQSYNFRRRAYGTFRQFADLQNHTPSSSAPLSGPHPKLV
jgi:hypothetical protein